MAICPSYSSTSEVSLYYAWDPNPTHDDLSDDTIAWQQIRMTGESLDIALTATVSEEITPQRSYANSVLTQGSVTGSFNFEASAGFLDNWLVSVLQANKELRWIGAAATGDRWTAGEAITNGTTKQCLCILERVLLSNGNYDWYVLRGVQVGALSLSFEPGANITGSVTVTGTGAQSYEDTAASSMTDWTFVPDYNNPLMSSVSSLTGLELKDSGGSDQGIIFQSFSLNLDNQLREQFGVGTGSIYAAGVGSGRFMATMDTSAYYSNPKIFNALLADSELKIVFSMLDSNSEGYTWLFDKVKVTSGGKPMADGPDADLMVKAAFQGFESQSNGTVKITKVGAGS